jgi:YjbE family integral membrane protein
MMTALFDVGFWTRIPTIMVIDIMLAGDNALLVALAVRTLPPRQQFLGRLWGSAGAVVLRLIFIAFVTLLLDVPLLRLAGGAVLLWIAVKLVGQSGSEAGAARSGMSLREAIWIIIVADVSMSLDNVIAIAGAAHGDLVLVAFGIGLSIPLVLWGSGLLARLMNRHPWIVSLGGGILGYVGGEMITADEFVKQWIGIMPVFDHVVPIALALAVVVLGSGPRRPVRTSVS